MHSWRMEYNKRAVLNGEISGCKKFYAAVPQSLVLWSYLFLICVNDLRDGIESICKIFGEGTFIFSVVNDEAKLQSIVKTDLETRSQCGHQWETRILINKQRKYISCESKNVLSNRLMWWVMYLARFINLIKFFNDSITSIFIINL